MLVLILVLVGGGAVGAEKGVVFEQVEYRVENLPRVMGHLVISSNGVMRLRAHRDGDEQDVPLPLGKDQLVEVDLAKLRELVGAVDWANVKARYAVEGRKPPTGASCHTIIATIDGKRYQTYVERMDKEGGPPGPVSDLVWFLAVLEGMTLPDPLPKQTPPSEFGVLRFSDGRGVVEIAGEGGAVSIDGKKAGALTKEELQRVKEKVTLVDWEWAGKNAAATKESRQTLGVTAGKREYRVDVESKNVSRQVGELANAVEGIRARYGAGG